MSETDLIVYQFSRVKVEQGDFSHFLSLYSPDKLPGGPGLKASLSVQAHLLISQPAGLFDLSKSHGLLERQLMRHIQRILKQLGRPVRKDEVVVVRSGAYVHVAFVWPLGTPGVLGRASKEHHLFQVSLVLRRWLREQRN